MIDFSIYKLIFTTPLHISNCRDDYSCSLHTVGSDSLLAAVISCIAKRGMTIPDDGDIGCTISSLFPFFYNPTNKKETFFFPKPYTKRISSTYVLQKKIKRIAWIDTYYFQKWINGEPEIREDDIHNEFLTKDSCLDGHFIISQETSRVSVSRTGLEDANPFVMERISFTKGSGLFFLAIGNTDKLEQGLDLLQYEGIGTDRNVGNGLFEYSKATIGLNVPTSSYALSLSSFIPENREQLASLISDKNSSYNLSRRGGWITTFPYIGLRKNYIYSFNPGSIFKYPINDVTTMGSIYDLSPKIEEPIHPIWRSGKSIFIPIKIKENE